MKIKTDMAISFTNGVQEADVWILPMTEENLKTTMWGTATAKSVKTGESRKTPLCKAGDEGQYIFRMIDTDEMYYSANGIKLEAGWTAEVKGDELNSITLEVKNADGEVDATYEVFAARL